MADSRRRTIASAGPSSGIPIPSSAARPVARQSLAASHSRQSMAPGRASLASRQSMAPMNSQDNGSQGSQMFSQGHGGPIREVPSTVGRSSVYTSAGAMSASRSSNVMRSGGPNDHAPGSERRSSTFRRSMAGGSTPQGLSNAHLTTARPPKDGREVRSIGARQRNAAYILDYLSSIGQVCEMKTLLTPTARDFGIIYKVLIGKLEAYKFGGTGKKFEEEVIPALRAVLYPFPDSITKSHLQAIGSQQSWPNMLAMLHWIVVVINSREDTFLNSPELHMPADYEYAESLPDHATHAWVDYIRATYPLFLASEEFEEQGTRELAIFYERVGRHTEEIEQRILEVKQSVEAKRKIVEELSSKASPLSLVEKEKSNLIKDSHSVDKYTAELGEKIAAGRAQLLLFDEKEEQYRQQAISADLERNQLNAQIEQQGISPVEIQNMTSEKANLQTALSQANAKQEAILQKSYDLEIDLGKVLNATSDLCSLWETKAAAVGLLPSPPPEFSHIDFFQQLNVAAENPVSDCQALRPVLLQLKARAKLESSEINDKDVALEEEIILVKENITEHREELEAQEMEIDQAEKELQDAKDITAGEFAISNGNMDRLQSEVNDANMTMNQGMMNANAYFDYRFAERDAARELSARTLQSNHDHFETFLVANLDYREMAGKKTKELWNSAGQ